MGRGWGTGGPFPMRFPARKEINLLYLTICSSTEQFCHSFYLKIFNKNMLKYSTLDHSTSCKY